MERALFHAARGAGRTSPNPLVGAVVVSADTYNQYGDLVVAAVTSHAPRVAMDCALRDWAAAGLKLPSTVRMLLATVASARILLHVGHLTERDWTEVQARLRMVFTWL